MAFRIRKEKENRPKKNAKSAELFGGSSKSPIIPDDKILQCHVPIVGCVCKGDPLPASISEGGIKMRCTNEKCSYARLLIHHECFDMLEKHLIKIISNIGSARGWTDNQRKHNLWEKKGLTLVQKLLRCKCDRGQMVRDTDFYKETRETKANTENKANVEEGNKLKKKKKKELPRLNFGYNSTVIPPSENSDLYKKKFNELESHFLSSHVDDDELSSVYSSDVIHSAGILNNSSNHQKVAKTNVYEGNNLKENKKNELPRLDFNCNPTVISPSENSNMYRKKFNGLESHFLSSHFDDDELSSVYSSDAIHLNNNHQKGAWSKTPSLASSVEKGGKRTPSPFNGYYESGGELIEMNYFASSPSSSAQRMASSTTYTLFGRTMSFFLGERILAELYLPSGAFS